PPPVVLCRKRIDQHYHDSEQDAEQRFSEQHGLRGEDRDANRGSRNNSRRYPPRQAGSKQLRSAGMPCDESCSRGGQQRIQGFRRQRRSRNRQESEEWGEHHRIERREMNAAVPSLTNTMDILLIALKRRLLAGVRL